MPELVNSHVVPVSRERAFAAFSDVEQIVRWWGPDGFTSTSEAFDFRPGGSWTMTMHGPDGANYPNFYRFLEIEPGSRVVFERPDPAHCFVVTATFDETPEGTRVTWRQHFDSESHFAEIKDVVEAANPQVLARLAAVVTR